MYYDNKEFGVNNGVIWRVKDALEAYCIWLQNTV